MFRERKAAKAGAEFLDRVRPGWHKEVNLGNLSIASGQYCVLGQLFNGFESGMDKLGLDYANAAEFGFQLHPSIMGAPTTYRGLNEAWGIEIMSRRLPPIPPVLVEEEELVPA